VQGAAVALGLQFNNGLAGFVELVSKPQVLELNLTADKLFIKLGEASIEPL
jgi:hypothetical protein